MSTGWFALSYIALWLLVLSSLALWIVMLRQIGVLHERLGTRRLMELEGGPQVGDPVELGTLVTLSGAPARVSAIETSVLLVFLGVGCVICRDIAPAVRAIMDDYDGVIPTFALIVTGEEPSRSNGRSTEFAQEYGLPFNRSVVGDLLARELAITETPAAVLVNSNGLVAGRSLPNTLEDLESLLHHEVQVST